ncbi:MAG TPA: amino acid adenylation domain-containing protein [Candidatus Angelobacter sp.]|nr:amino acid adenylation domain-containing protein [Candidatus Angelobacter sp.]
MSSQTAFQVAEGFRLSPQQRRFWHLHEAHPASAFGTQCTVALKGALDEGRFAQAVGRVVARYEILRTSFGFLEGTSVPVQIVNGPAPGLEPMIDLRSVDSQRRESEVRLTLHQELSRFRDPSTCPAMSFALVRLADAEHLFILTASALCADMASVVNIVCQVQDVYSGHNIDDVEALQYADLSEWQNQLLESPADSNHTPYWKSPEFPDALFPRLPFVLRREAEREGSSSCGTMEQVVAEETAAAITALAQDLQVSPQAILLGAWQHLLKSFSGMETFLVGTELDGRVQDELRAAVGVFAKYLPLNIQCNSQVSGFIQQTHAAVEIARYDQLQFDWQALGTREVSHRCRSYPVIFSSLELPRLEAIGSLAWEFRTGFECREPYELALSAVSTIRGLRLHFSWDSAVYAQKDIALLANAYTVLLEGITRNPEGRLDELDMGAANDASCAPSEPVQETNWPTLEELFAAQVRRVPQQLAVVCEDQQLTYAELDRRSSVLAARLQEIGAGPDMVIALVAERSIHFVVGMLAVLKAGAAWLPIEPDTPTERVDYIMKQARAVAVVTQRVLPQTIECGDLPRIFADDSSLDAPSVFKGAEQLPSRKAMPAGRLAYVIFTSGSTGRPKGVGIEHRQVASYVHALLERVHPQTSADFALVSTVAADLGHTSMFAALSCGGCLHMLPAWRAVDLDALAEYFLSHSVEFVKIVPAHLEALCRSLPDSARLPWRQLLVGGELLTSKLVELVKKFAPDCEVFNHYGPTETTVGVFCGPADPNLERYASPNIPIGRPFSGVTAYLLDENMRRVPTWMPGELHIGGESVGRGYVGEGALTAERFLPDPFYPLPGSRMYRTGDVARYRSDGAVEFLGRRDGQIKIRGYRVETGEIEAVLGRHPAVRNAAVVVREDKSTGNYLQAFVAVGPAKVTAEELRSFVAKTLPPYMVPSGIFCVDRLKLTPNGKVDRQALPAVTESLTAARFREPRNEVEESLVAVFRKVLGVEQVSTDDNYFSMGGDSLRVIQVVHEARRYGIKIGATDVLRHQTVRKLACALQERALSGLFPNGVPALPQPSPEMLQGLPGGVADVYQLSGIQTFVAEKYAQDHQRKGVYHVQESIHVSDTGFSIQALEMAFRTVVDRHPVLRTVIDVECTPPMQWVRRDLQWKLQVDDISHLTFAEQEDRIAAALISDRSRAFDLADRESPLFRASVFLRSATDFNWFFSCHHAIIDGWGHRVLLNQLVQTYVAIKAGRKVELGIPDSTYREFVAYQEAVRRSDKASEFWMQYLDGVGAHPAPRSAPASPVKLEDASVVHQLDAALVEALSRVARAQAVSMQALILSAWLESLRGLTGQESVTTGVITNGRSEHLSDPLSAIGLFWNIVPVVSRIALPMLDHMAVIQKDLIEMEPYSAYPLPQLIADQDGRDLFFCSFRYLNFWNLQQAPAESGLRMLGMRAFDRYSFPLSCTASFNPLSGGGLLQLEYDPEVFAADTLRAMLDNFAALLENAASSGVQSPRE